MADELLHVTAGAAAGTEISLGDVFTIGRAEGGDGALGDDPEISRQHARITRVGTGDLLIEDLGSTNGTFVNGEQISSPMPLRGGDRIQVGKSTLELVEVFQPAPGPDTPVEPAFVPPPPPPEEPGLETAPPAPPPEPVPAEPEPVPAEPEPVPAEPEPEPAPPEPEPEPEPELQGPVPMHMLDYLRAQKTLTLATTGRDGPWAATMTYVHSGRDIYIWTRPDTNTARNLSDDPTVAFTIDEYAGDWRQTRGLQGRGEATSVEGEGVAVASDLFGDKFPDLRPGSTTTVLFFKITPRTLDFIDNTRGVEESADFGAELHSESIILPPYED